MFVFPYKKFCPPPTPSFLVVFFEKKKENKKQNTKNPSCLRCLLRPEKRALATYNWQMSKKNKLLQR